MKNAKQVLLIIICIVGAFLGGYLAVIADISIPLTGHDLTGMAGVSDQDPRMLTIDDYIPIFLHTMIGIGCLTLALITFLKLKENAQVSDKEKLSIFLQIFNVSCVVLWLFAFWLSSETRPLQKEFIKYWFVGLFLILIFYVIEVIIKRRRGN